MVMCRDKVCDVIISVSFLEDDQANFMKQILVAHRSAAAEVYLAVFDRFLIDFLR